MADHTTLHVNCSADEKSVWMLTARIEGMAFEDWVRAKLNSHVIDANPSWLNGLTERARICLLGAGFKSRRGVTKAVKEGFDISALPNAGRRVKEEVLGWLK